MSFQAQKNCGRDIKKKIWYKNVIYDKNIERGLF